MVERQLGLVRFRQETPVAFADELKAKLSSLKRRRRELGGA